MITDMNNLRKGTGFVLRGFYHTDNSFDWRYKLANLLDPEIGYYFDSTREGSVENPDYAIFTPIADVIVASPKVDSLYILSDILQHREQKDTKLIFTYLDNYAGEAYTPEQLEELDKVGKIVADNGDLFIRCKSLDMLAGNLNMYAKYSSPKKAL